MSCKLAAYWNKASCKYEVVNPIRVPCKRNKTWCIILKCQFALPVSCTSYQECICHLKREKRVPISVFESRNSYIYMYFRAHQEKRGFKR